MKTYIRRQQHKKKIKHQDIKQKEPIKASIVKQHAKISQHALKEYNTYSEQIDGKTTACKYCT